MLADNTAHLIAAAHRRSEATMKRAGAAITAAEQAGVATTLTALARTAGVSRAWLYTQPGLLDRIRPLTTARPGRPSATVPASQRSTDASLRTRLDLALRRNRELARENQQLKVDLQNALGQVRSRRAVSALPPGTDCHE